LQLDGRIVGILHSVNDGVADAVKDEDTHVLWGGSTFRERICGLDFVVSAYSFFQTNSAGAEVLYDVVNNYAIENAPPQASAYDLYCGTGTITQVLSRCFSKVMGIELNHDAVKAAQENMRLNNITNCEFIAGDVLALLDGLDRKPDVVVVDPPRDGLHPKALAKIINLAPPTLIYVACKPASLARDMALLAEAGYVPAGVTGVDLFPRTPHVEAVCVMQLFN